MEEYVPIIIPTTKVNANPLMTSPPKRYSETTVKNVNPEVRMVRLSV
jgi:hypothetical protein